MIKNAISWKVLEVAIKKRDFTFLARHLVQHLDQAGWSHEDLVAFRDKLGTIISHSGSKAGHNDPRPS